ncbi:uncharacterized protein TNCV_1687321 [Trichonephila clavipes]|nr:uncharacterized protein TNCV_1687321 [Trichonephila clavipes]
MAAVAEWYRYQTVACFVTSSSPVPLKTRRVGQRCSLNLSRAETSSRWCSVVWGPVSGTVVTDVGVIVVVWGPRIIDTASATPLSKAYRTHLSTRDHWALRSEVILSKEELNLGQALQDINKEEFQLERDVYKLS